MQSEAMAFSKEYDKSYEISVPVSSRCRLNMPQFFFRMDIQTEIPHQYHTLHADAQ